MGELRPTAIVVTALFPKVDEVRGLHWGEVARGAALEIFARFDLAHLVSGLVITPMNDTQSFLVAWDGSKEGWPTSGAADRARAEFVKWLRAQAYEDGSSPLHWVELAYAGDQGGAQVLATSSAELVTGGLVSQFPRPEMQEIFGPVTDSVDMNLRW